MRSTLRLASMLVLVVVGAGCASGGATGTPGYDAGRGPSSDGGPSDAGDAGRDAGQPAVDAGWEDAGWEDAAVDPGTDAGVVELDAGLVDAGTVEVDAGTIGVDAGTDAGMTGPCAGAADGTACDADGDGCTVGDRCMGGVCVAGPRETCGGSTGMCGGSVCVSTGPDGYRCDPVGVGMSCDDGNACTTGDTCGPDGICSGTPVTDSREPNNTRATAYNLGSISDGSSFPAGTFTASLYPDGDEDWYRYYVSDDLFAWIYPRVELQNVPSGNDYDLCVYFQCPSGSTSASCEIGSSSTFEGLPGCCSRAAGSANETVELNPDCSGSNDSGTVYVRVWRHSGPSTCSSYTLRWGDN